MKNWVEKRLGEFNQAYWGEKPAGLRGRLIIFDGLDKLGKTTQAKLLYKYMKIEGKVKYFKQPTNANDTIKSRLRDIIKDENVKLDYLAEWALHLASHAQQWTYSILPALESGYDVILDRSWYSALAYQGYGRGLPKDLIIKAETLASYGIEPRYLFIFHSCFENPLEVEADKDPIESELLRDKAFNSRVSEGFFAIGAENGMIIDMEQYAGKKFLLHDMIKAVVCREDKVTA